MIRAYAIATVAVAIALAACSGRGVVPPASTALAPVSYGDISPLAVTTCATSPPQYEWIFKGACDKFTLKPGGGTFKLQEYEDITVTGSIGENDVKGSALIYLVDAIDKNGDIEKDKSKTFPPYNAAGTTIVYAVAINQSKQTIKPKSVKNKAVLQYVITDTKGLPGNTCGAAVLTEPKPGKFTWTSLPAQGPVKGKTVTISQYEVPSGFELPPQLPLYFAVNCFK